jgi:cysteinyl-tRNA synthetase
MKHLGEYCDIHCGGIDNAFPHHTNEIAQSEAYLGHEWCRHWMHVLHLNTNSGKMSKSSGEFLTVSLLESKGYSPLAYRFFCMQSHYRKSLVFSYENLDNATTAYNKLVAKIAPLLREDNGEVDAEVFAQLKKRFTDALDNDLNTSLAVTALYDVLKAKTNAATKLAAIRDFEQVLMLGLIDAASAINAAEDAEAAAKAAAKAAAAAADPEYARIEALVEARTAAKKAKNFAEADRIRNELAAEGITLIDSAKGTEWKRN